MATAATRPPPLDLPIRYPLRVSKGEIPGVIDLLTRLREGDSEASDELLKLIHAELHGMARKMMSRQGAGHTLQTTALLNEAWMRLAGANGTYNDRQHFMSAAARAMRSVLVDYARRKTTGKRRRDLSRPLEFDPIASLEHQPEDLILLDELLGRLGESNKELLRIVELRFFAGLTLEETGAVLGMTVRQVHRRWTVARGWLRTQIEKDDAAARARGTGGDVD